jgi:hypothetical protein
LQPAYEFVEADDDDSMHDHPRPVFAEELAERPHKLTATARKSGRQMTKAISKLHRGGTTMVDSPIALGAGHELVKAGAAVKTTAGKWRKGLRARME